MNLKFVYLYYVLEEVMYLKLDLKCLKLEFKVGILCIFQSRIIN